MSYVSVYCRTNTKDNKKYVGVTSLSIEERWEKMIRRTLDLQERQVKIGRLPRQLKYPTIYRAIIDDGIDSFEHECLDKHDNLLLALVSERRWIAKLNTNMKRGGHGYNRSDGGEVSLIGSSKTISLEDLVEMTSSIKIYMDDSTLSLPEITEKTVVAPRVSKFNTFNLDMLVSELNNEQ
jgi:hypothetical protein